MYRVAIVGSGAAGLYAAQELLENSDSKVDVFERSVTPLGLIRYGVSPDHHSVRAISGLFDRKVAQHPDFTYRGNVTVGNIAEGADLSFEELSNQYDQVLIATGSQSERDLGIPGEHLDRVYASKDIVEWYNGFPDATDLDPHLEGKGAIVGAGNVAKDLASILSGGDRLYSDSDAPLYAVDALRDRPVKELDILIRRGPAQLAMDSNQLGQLEKLARLDPDINIYVDEDDYNRFDDFITDDFTPKDEPSRLEYEAIGANDQAEVRKKLRLLKKKIPKRKDDGAAVNIRLRFLESPVKVLGPITDDDPEGTASGLVVRYNELYFDEAAKRTRVRPKTPTQEEDHTGYVAGTDFIVRSIGYRGEEIPGLPFEKWGVIPSQAPGAGMEHGSGRVILETGEIMPGVYTTGWIKRGPKGTIRSNREDAQQVVSAMIFDREKYGFGEYEGRTIDQILQERDVRTVSWGDWKVIEGYEVGVGDREGRPREKLISVDDMFDVIDAYKEISHIVDLTPREFGRLNYLSARNTQRMALTKDLLDDYRIDKENTDLTTYGALLWRNTSTLAARYEDVRRSVHDTMQGFISGRNGNTPTELFEEFVRSNPNVLLWNDATLDRKLDFEVSRFLDSFEEVVPPVKVYAK